MGRIRKSLGRRIDYLAKWLLRFRLVSIPARAVANSSYAWSFISRTDRIRANRLRDRLKEGELPQHISIIMDGNRRFAWNSNIERDLGHRRGKEKLKEVMDWILDLEIPYLTVYALSTENINERSPGELDSLYDLYVAGLNEIADDPQIHERGVRVQAMGRLEMLPERVREAISNAQSRTESYTDFLFTVCLAYGGREEIVDAVREVAADHAKGDLPLESIDTMQISSRMYTSDLPDPDLVIRTSGEERISNFLLWQIAYSELHFTDVFWPSFSKVDLYEAIESYQSRRRRYGG
ncbi:MAG: di-trans,poly-cis-decaprenylcistransferase [Candidatus Thalassarchaeum betae]|jgi:tritrans,polycis-undecaprenyl-diphosphate synthase [geranylgeranyl-diphosphate specific]|uniref:Tritrans,polycis-undecaprenyl-diphosphate synthase (geranylgeranyl-diphosphate specific) n=1 Tax=Candidatus Thalassarchaeum betae TaxID=2599289 RepID=A0A2V3HTU0_9ARCH|nr:MAG: di-trans,poly-cis-decaprenylcistransferase [Candidatus Thalassoarchaea betae]HIM92865.1 di-trans,poly-cis-decaprenylcistransferase [Candidatus Poseidoniales archaeon]